MTNKAIECLVDENFVYAKVLAFFGVQFYENRGKTLDQVCQEYKLNVEQLKSLLENNDQERLSTHELKNYPARLIIEYLKHSHQLFIKDRLPYILKLINAMDDEGSHAMIHDLKFIMPLFVEDFIEHIYEEEDRFFQYVTKLEDAVLKNKGVSTIGLEMKKFSIREFALHHGDSDDEMQGIRGITDQYKLDDIRDIHLKVILQELQAFDSDLEHHATIENQILFPKALTLEKRVQHILTAHSALN